MQREAHNLKESKNQRNGGRYGAAYATDALLLAVIVGALVLAVGMATTTKPAIANPLVGRWEVVSGTGLAGLVLGPGSLIDFYADGSVSSFGTLAGRYSQPDAAHLRLELPGSTALLVELRFTNSEQDLAVLDSNQTWLLDLTRYHELPASPTTVGAIWNLAVPGTNTCMRTLGLSHPPAIVQLTSQGVFAAVEQSLLPPTLVDLTGSYALRGGQIDISAIGSVNRARVQGHATCTITVSRMRLSLADAAGQPSIYVRH